MRNARRDAGKRAKAAQQIAAERAIVPEGNRVVPSLARGHVVAKARRSFAFIGTNLPLKRDRIVGMLEFGGVIRGAISPRRKGGALRLKDGSFVARVNKPRKIEAKHMLQGAVQRRFDDYTDALAPELMKAFDDFEHTP